MLMSLLIAFMVGCSKKQEEVVFNDNYRNYYEIFVGAFYDSNGDGKGDIRGVIKKLDYLNDGNSNTKKDLGVDGIWLMPIMPSNTYHKYDVKDYFSIDPDYGTMEDFEELIRECNNRGIKVIIDLVLNHTATDNPWFQSAKKSIAIEPCGTEPCIYKELCREHNKYCNYYNFTREKLSGYHSVGMPTGWYYEGVFWDQMPDLNLENEEVWKEIEKIGSFWLEKGVAGFRLDAVTSYYSGNIEKNNEALKRFNNTMEKYKEDVYIVGEAWTDAASIKRYYESGIDSFFNFPFSDTDGIIVNAIREGNGETFAEKLQLWQQDLEGINKMSIDASFLSNHDMGRSGGVLMRDTVKEKMAASIYLLIPGNSFIYYGEEIGMTGSGKDENKRLPMLWSKKNKNGLTSAPLGATQNNDELEAGVEEQEKDKNSLLEFYKKILRLKLENPEIARGKITALNLGQKSVAAYSVEYEGERSYIIHNLSDIGVSLEFSKDCYNYRGIIGNLTTGEQRVTLKSDILNLPPMSTVIIK